MLGKECRCGEFTLEEGRRVRALVLSMSIHSGEERKELENSKFKLTFLWLMTIFVRGERSHFT